jgi:cbb3-type cytochrome oxidase maturation protein
VDILYLLIPLSVVLAILIGAALWLAMDGGQFDDLDRPALDVVLDDDRPPAAVDARQSRPRAR